MSQQNIKDFNDKNYPIEPIWVLKNTVVSLIILPFFVAFATFIFWSKISNSINLSARSYEGLIYIGFFILSVPIHFFTNVIRRATFHYQFDDKFFNLKQGLINRQNRQLPYGVIQNVILVRGLLDRIFGLSTLIIQNASQSSPVDLKSQAAGMAGFYGNTVQIPGLSKENAEIVKVALLEKVRQSPIIELGM